MSVMNSKKLNFQTTWNMEMPYEMMLRAKKQVPVVMKMVSGPVVRAYKKVYRQARILENSFEEAKEMGKVMFKKVVDKIAALDSSVITTVTDKMILILKEYQKKAEIVLNAVVRFLRETKFQIPGYERRLSGLEVYQKISTFVADVSEEAVQTIHEYFVSMFTAVFDYISAVEFKLPGSNYVVRGREILDNLIATLEKIKDQVIVTVRKLGSIQLEDIISRFYAFTEFAMEQSEKFLQILKSQNVEGLYTFLTNVYSDFMKSDFMVDVSKRVEEIHRIIMEYLKTVRAQIQDLFAEISSAQFQSDIQSSIDLKIKRLNSFQNNVIKTLKEKSKNLEPFVRVSDRQMEVDIPLPFVA